MQKHVPKRAPFPLPSRSLSHCLASLSRSLQRAHQQLARGDFNETRRWAPIAAIKINYSICQLCGATVAHQMCPGREREREGHTLRKWQRKRAEGRGQLPGGVLQDALHWLQSQSLIKCRKECCCCCSLLNVVVVVDVVVDRSCCCVKISQLG